MDVKKTLNSLLVTAFQDVLDIEEKTLITGEFTDITMNDMHVIEAIGAIISSSFLSIFPVSANSIASFPRGRKHSGPAFHGATCPDSGNRQPSSPHP